MMVCIAGRISALVNKFVAGVWVSIEARKIRRADFEPNPMPPLEDVRGRPHIDFELFDLAGREHRGRRPRIAPSRTDDAVGEIQRGAAWAHVHQLGGEVGVGRRRGCVKRERDRTGHFEVFGAADRSSTRARRRDARPLADRTLRPAARRRSSRARRRRSARDRAGCRGTNRAARSPGVSVESAPSPYMLLARPRLCR